MVTYQYAPAVDGGAERQAQRLAEGLAARGRQVGVVTPRFPALPRYERLGGVDVHRLWAAPLFGRISSTYLPSLAAFLFTRARRFDIWHAHQAYYNAALAVCVARVSGRHRVVVKAAASGPHGDFARLRQSPMGRWVQEAIVGADAIISLNAELTAELGAVGIDAARIRHIPNGVDCAYFAPPSPQERRDAREAFGISPDGALVVFAGRLTEAKGVGYLIEAWRRIEEARPDQAWTLFVAGDEAGRGEYRQRAMRELRRARFLGKVSDMRPLLAAADVLVLPSLSEGVSNVVLEAMATGLPVVATNIGGLTEQIEDGVSGCLVAPRDPDALVRALTTVLCQPELRAAMGAAGRLRATQRYSLTSMVDAYEDLYDRLAYEPVGGRPAASA